MSCKIVTGSAIPAAQSVIWPSVGESPATYQIASPGTRDLHPPETSSAELASLRKRVAELESSVATEVRAASEASYHEGERAGRIAGRAELEPVLQRVSKSLGEVAALRSRVRRETEKELVMLSIAVARRVLHRELSVNPDAIQALVRTTLEGIQARDICRVRMSPEHQQLLQLRPGLLPPGVEIIADSSLPLGGLIVETKRGNVDASVESQLSEIERGFADRIGK